MWHGPNQYESCGRVSIHAQWILQQVVCTAAAVAIGVLMWSQLVHSEAADTSNSCFQAASFQDLHSRMTRDFTANDFSYCNCTEILCCNNFTTCSAGQVLDLNLSGKAITGNIIAVWDTGQWGAVRQAILRNNPKLSGDLPGALLNLPSLFRLDLRNTSIQLPFYPNDTQLLHMERAVPPNTPSQTAQYLQPTDTWQAPGLGSFSTDAGGALLDKLTLTTYTNIPAGHAARDFMECPMSVTFQDRIQIRMDPWSYHYGFCRDVPGSFTSVHTAGRKNKRIILALSIIIGIKATILITAAIAFIWYHKVWRARDTEHTPDACRRWSQESIPPVAQSAAQLGTSFNTMESSKQDVSDSTKSKQLDRTFVVTDVEGSTELWEYDAEVMDRATQMHDMTLRLLLYKHNGREVCTEGDSFTCVFRDAGQAVGWCLHVQQALLRLRWPTGLTSHKAASVVWEEMPGNGLDTSNCTELIFAGFRVRMGLHTGSSYHIIRSPLTGQWEYMGKSCSIAEAICSAGYGGQVLLSQHTYQSIYSKLPRLSGTLDAWAETHRMSNSEVEPLDTSALPDDIVEAVPSLAKMQTRPQSMRRSSSMFTDSAAQRAALAVAMPGDVLRSALDLSFRRVSKIIAGSNANEEETKSDAARVGVVMGNMVSLLPSTQLSRTLSGHQKVVPREGTRWSISSASGCSLPSEEFMPDLHSRGSFWMESTPPLGAAMDVPYLPPRLTTELLKSRPTKLTRSLSSGHHKVPPKRSVSESSMDSFRKRTMSESAATLAAIVPHSASDDGTVSEAGASILAPSVPLSASVHGEMSEGPSALAAVVPGSVSYDGPRFGGAETAVQDSSDGTITDGIISNGTVYNGTVSNGTVETTVSSGTVSNRTVFNGTGYNGTLSNGTVSNAGTVPISTTDNTSNTPTDSLPHGSTPNSIEGAQLPQTSRHASTESVHSDADTEAGSNMVSANMDITDWSAIADGSFPLPGGVVLESNKRLSDPTGMKETGVAGRQATRPLSAGSASTTLGVRRKPSIVGQDTHGRVRREPSRLSQVSVNDKQNLEKEVHEPEEASSRTLTKPPSVQETSVVELARLLRHSIDQPNFSSMGIQGLDIAEPCSNLPVTARQSASLIQGVVDRISTGAVDSGVSTGEPLPVVVNMGKFNISVANEEEEMHIIMVLPFGLYLRMLHWPHNLQGLCQIQPSFLDAPSTKSCIRYIGTNLPVAMRPRITLAFCSIDSKTAAALQSDTSSDALLLFCEVVRYTLQVCKGYECQEKAGTFMIAFANVPDALEWALVLQMALMKVEWGSVLGSASKPLPSTQSVMGKTGSILFKGMRARVGLMHGEVVKVTPHGSTGRADYFGMVLNRAARIQAAAFGGQVLAESLGVDSAVQHWRLCYPQDLLTNESSSPDLRSSFLNRFLPGAVSRQSSANLKEKVLKAADSTVDVVAGTLRSLSLKATTTVRVPTQQSSSTPVSTASIPSPIASTHISSDIIDPSGIASLKPAYMRKGILAPLSIEVPASWMQLNAVHPEPSIFTSPSAQSVPSNTRLEGNLSDSSSKEPARRDVPKSVRTTGRPSCSGSEGMGEDTNWALQALQKRSGSVRFSACLSPATAAPSRGDSEDTEMTDFTPRHTSAILSKGIGGSFRLLPPPVAKAFSRKFWPESFPRKPVKVDLLDIGMFTLKGVDGSVAVTSIAVSDLSERHLHFPRQLPTAKVKQVKKGRGMLDQVVVMLPDLDAMHLPSAESVLIDSLKKNP